MAEQKTSAALLEGPVQEQVAPAELCWLLARAACTIEPKAQATASCAGLVLTFGEEPQPHVYRLRWRTDGSTRERRSAVIHVVASVLWQTRGLGSI